MSSLPRLFVAATGVAAMVWPWKMEACGTNYKYVSLYSPLDDVFTPATSEPRATALCIAGLLVLQAAAHVPAVSNRMRMLVLVLMIGWACLTTGMHGLMSPKCPKATLLFGPFFAYGSVFGLGLHVYFSSAT